MTTIAWDGQTLAADTQVNSCNNIPCGATTKIGKTPDGYFWAFSGSLQCQETLVEWACGDRLGPLPTFKESNGCLILIAPDGVVREWWGEGWIQMRAAVFAWGSGERIAMGAMLAGADARRAVEIAIALDSDTGGEITVIRCPDAVVSRSASLTGAVRSVSGTLAAGVGWGS